MGWQLPQQLCIHPEEILSCHSDRESNPKGNEKQQCEQLCNRFKGNYIMTLRREIYSRKDLKQMYCIMLFTTKGLTNY